MAHKTLVDATAHKITGGRILVNGTGYKIKSGKTTVDGTVYEVGFAPDTIKLNFVDPPWMDNGYTTSEFYYKTPGALWGERLYEGGVYELPFGTILSIYMEGVNQYSSVSLSVSLNGTTVAEGDGRRCSYEHTLTTNTIITVNKGTYGQEAHVYITEQ